MNTYKNYSIICLRIFFSLILAFIFLIFSSIQVGAAVSLKKGADSCGSIKFSVQPGTCTAWKKKGTSCKPTLDVHYRGNAFKNLHITTGSTSFTNNGSKSLAFTAESNQLGSSSATYCNVFFTLQVSNVFDGSKPQCAGTKITSSTYKSVTVQVLALESPSGISGGTAIGGNLWYVTKTFTSNGTHSVTMTDNVGYTVTCPVTINSIDVTPPSSGTCSSATGWINKDSGAQIKGKCSSDSQSGCDGQWRTTTISYAGYTGYPSICDRAGNCKSISCSFKGSWETSNPYCPRYDLYSDQSNGYRLGTVTTVFQCSDSQSGCQSGSYTTYTSSNALTYSTTTVYDNALNSAGTGFARRAGTCRSDWYRDQTGPYDCDSEEQSTFSNSSIRFRAWCTRDAGVGCGSSPNNRYGDFSTNGRHYIDVYDLTEKYSGDLSTNRYPCPVEVTHIDQAAPTCSASISLANPVLSTDKTTWTTNTWHTSNTIYDENGRVISTTNQGSGTNITRVQAWVNNSTDNATTSGKASGVKTGFTGVSSYNDVNTTALSDEAKTVLSEGNDNGLYTVFTRDNVIDNVTHDKKGLELYYFICP